MSKTVLITGSTDGIGLATAKLLIEQGHRVLLHGRNPQKLEETQQLLRKQAGGEHIEGYIADLSHLPDVIKLADSVNKQQGKLDVLINNAGIFKTADTITSDGLDVRFVVNTIAPYLLTQKLLPLLGTSGRVISLSSAAQSPVNTEALLGNTQLSEHFAAYAQSKLALTMWSQHLALTLKDSGPTLIAVNPGSMLGTKMVKQGFGSSGNDIGIGADILARAALSDEFSGHSGEYFDNDAGAFSSPHPDALNSVKVTAVIAAIEAVLAEHQTAQS